MMILQVYKTTDCYRIILHTLAAIEKIYPVKFAENFTGALGKTAQKEFLPGMIYLTGLPGELLLTGLQMPSAGADL